MCFSLPWFEELLVSLVIFVAVIAILRLFLPWIFGVLGVSTGPLLAIINIIIWAIVVIYAIYIVFALIECLLASGAGFPSLLPRHS